MSEQEIENGNKLIAEFIGYNGNYDNCCKYSQAWYDEIKYHASWDWLMPVVEKIYMMYKIVDDVNIKCGKTEIKLKNGFQAIESPCLTQNNMITECWIAVVKFIEWYNSQPVSHK